MSEDISPHDSKEKTGPKGPSKPLTDEKFSQLKEMIKIQCTQEECCAVLGMSDSTLKRRLKERGIDNFEELHRDLRAEGRRSIRRMQWEAATNGNTKMLEILGKHYLDQRDKSTVELTGADGGEIITRIERVIVDPSDKDA
jgi:AraC-like DNA-binding protein